MNDSNMATIKGPRRVMKLFSTLVDVILESLEDGTPAVRATFMLDPDGEEITVVIHKMKPGEEMPER